ncbi:MAG TPA: GNAT family N-acetyltransferase [Bryobacteraceae bacterium]|nr:GNAT family N-acetyltransferase [Bryobacteraceae bacterium]
MSEMFADLALSRKLETAEGLAGMAYVEARARLSPEAGAVWRQIAGATALFEGLQSPVTQTFGLGLNGIVTAEDLDQLEAFFTERGAPVNHEISPMAHPSIWPLLTARGYTPIEFTSLLYRDLASDPPAPSRVRGIEIRRAEEDPGTWARVSTEGWSETAEFGDILPEMMRMMLATSGFKPFLAWSEGEPIAAAALNVRGPVAFLAGAATIPRARGRGAQRALLEERLRAALAEGCEIAAMGALAGSTSQRNAERAGFRIAYTRTKWRLETRRSL